MNFITKRSISVFVDLLILSLIVMLIARFFIMFSDYLVHYNLSPVDDAANNTRVHPFRISSYIGSAFTSLPIYFGVFESRFWQASIGKKIMGLKVVDDNENRIIFWRALGRGMLFMTVMPISWFFILVTKKHEGLHDWMSGTKVIEN